MLCVRSINGNSVVHSRHAWVMSAPIAKFNASFFPPLNSCPWVTFAKFGFLIQNRGRYLKQYLFSLHTTHNFIFVNNANLVPYYWVYWPVPLAARSRRRSAVARLRRLWDSNPAGGMDICLLWVLCVVRLWPKHVVVSITQSLNTPQWLRCVWLYTFSELITGREELYWLWCVGVCDRNIVNEKTLATWGCCAKRTRNTFTKAIFKYNINDASMLFLKMF